MNQTQKKMNQPDQPTQPAKPVQPSQAGQAGEPDHPDLVNKECIQKPVRVVSKRITYI